jgi:hypothetical protein
MVDVLMAKLQQVALELEDLAEDSQVVLHQQQVELKGQEEGEEDY